MVTWKGPVKSMLCTVCRGSMRLTALVFRVPVRHANLVTSWSILLWLFACSHGLVVDNNQSMSLPSASWTIQSDLNTVNGIRANTRYSERLPLGPIFFRNSPAILWISYTRYIVIVIVNEFLIFKEVVSPGIWTCYCECRTSRGHFFFPFPSVSPFHPISHPVSLPLFSSSTRFLTSSKVIEKTK